MPRPEGDLLHRKKTWNVLVKPLLGGVSSLTLAVMIAVLGADSLDKYKLPSPLSDKATNEEKTAYAKAKAEVDPRRADHPALTLVADYRLWIIAVMVALSSVPSFLSARKAANLRHEARTDMIRRYLRIVRQRWFPDIDGLTKNARVSLFVLESPKGGKRLTCVFRTDERLPKRSWPVDKEEGFVVRAFRGQVTYFAAALDTGKGDDLERYLRETWATDEILKDRSWTGPAMLAVPMVMKPGAQPEAVFLVEAIGTDLAEARFYETEADLCRMLMEEPA
jgi:hypothetical protein